MVPQQIELSKVSLVHETELAGRPPAAELQPQLSVPRAQSVLQPGHAASPVIDPPSPTSLQLPLQDARMHASKSADFPEVAALSNDAQSPSAQSSSAPSVPLQASSPQHASSWELQLVSIQAEHAPESFAR